MNEINHNNSKFGWGSAVSWFLIGALVVGIPTFIAGVLYGNLDPYYNRYVEEAEVANRVIASNPEFKKLYIQHSSEGEVGLAGVVPTKEAYSKLEATVIDQFGRMILEMRMRCVEVSQSPTPNK